ncbi:MAG: glutamate--cysteine ligase [Gammaproteobacteria bacterium]
MGQEIYAAAYDSADFEHFHQHLSAETKLLGKLIANAACSERSPVAGFEIEAWLLHDDMRPASLNKQYLASFDNPLAAPELAKFNIELNTSPTPLAGNAFTRLYNDMRATWELAAQHAEQMDLHLLMIGTLPTLRQDDLHLGNMSDMNRYRALNEQILLTRGKPIHLDINGNEHLKIEHHDVMLEAATTSFQLHLQVPLSLAHHFYNASIVASAPMVALCANAPYVFGKDLWHESRIPMFEQAIASGGYRGAAQGPLRRVSFGSDFARRSLQECFIENLEHFPILLPERFDTAPENFQYLRLHNGTIWRWNRPLVGFDADGTPHLRIEHRTPAAGPTVLDAIANAAFFYGLTKNLCDTIIAGNMDMSFAQARDNFYHAARFGLDSHIVWLNGKKQRLPALFKNELLPRAVLGLKSLGVSRCDTEDYLAIIQHRVATQQNGSRWQHEFMRRHDNDLTALTRCYLNNQRRDIPVSEWEFS